MPELTPEREPSQQVKNQVKERDNNCCLSCGETTTKLLQIDHVAPSFFGGSNHLDNLQTLCRVCNNHKGGIHEINFRNHQTLLHGAPDRFAELKPPKTQHAYEAADWEKFLRRSVNFFYRCAAVQRVTIGKRGHGFYNWEIYLYDGNEPAWIKPSLPELIKLIKECRANVGRQGPDSIRIGAPDREFVQVSL